jgi:hypothetical protein
VTAGAAARLTGIALWLDATVTDIEAAMSCGPIAVGVPAAMLLTAVNTLAWVVSVEKSVVLALISTVTGFSTPFTQVTERLFATV